MSSGAGAVCRVCGVASKVVGGVSDTVHFLLTHFTSLQSSGSSRVINRDDRVSTRYDSVCTCLQTLLVWHNGVDVPSNSPAQFEEPVQTSLRGTADADVLWDKWVAQFVKALTLRVFLLSKQRHSSSKYPRVTLASTCDTLGLDDGLRKVPRSPAVCVGVVQELVNSSQRPVFLQMVTV